MNPTYSEFLNQLTDELRAIKGSSVNSTNNGEYFVFYIDSTQLSQFKLSVYDQLLKYNTYEYVYDYFRNYILGFIGGGGSPRPSGSNDPPPPPAYKIQRKIIPI
jgi:hypothetical protein